MLVRSLSYAQAKNWLRWSVGGVLGAVNLIGIGLGAALVSQPHICSLHAPGFLQHFITEQFILQTCQWLHAVPGAMVITLITALCVSLAAWFLVVDIPGEVAKFVNRQRLREVAEQALKLDRLLEDVETNVLLQAPNEAIRGLQSVLNKYRTTLQKLIGAEPAQL
ncbi:MAG: hypothetical protein AAGF24_03520 [Cyanobacteria bacterium P01_H01_bin.121]